MPELARNLPGDTGLNVTRLGFGAMEIRGVPRGPLSADVYAQAKKRLAEIGQVPA